MPWFEAMLPRLNELLTHEKIGDLSADLFAGHLTLVEILRELGVFVRDGESDFVSQLPQSMQEAFIAVLGSNLRRDTRKQMIVSWAPAYDWEMCIWESTSTESTAGGITVQIKSRYPADTHPGRRQREARAEGQAGDDTRRWR